MTDASGEANPLSVPMRMAELVEYQSGSVVSRTIVKEPTGTVSLFAFAEGEGLSEHTAPFDALVTILDGAARITVGEEVHHVEAGEGLHLPANIPHALHASTPFKMMLVMIRRPQ